MRLLRLSYRPVAPERGRVFFLVAQCLPFAISLLVVGIEFSPAHVLYTGPLLTATPALAAVALGPKGTVAAAGVALAVSVVTATYNQAWGSLQVYTNFLALALVSTAGFITSSAVQKRRRNELNQVRRVAMAAQQVLLRPVPSRLGQVRAASMYLAAEKGAQIGGDLYDVVQTRYGVRMIVGDVRGKGLPGVRSAAAVLRAFREAVHYESELVEVMNRCTAALRRERALPGTSDERSEEYDAEEFVTALIAQVPHQPVIQLVNRGHPPPLVLREGNVEALVPTTPLPPLGLEELVIDDAVKEDSYPFAVGDCVLLYTDGVVEARNRENAFFPLPEAVKATRAATPRECLERLHQELVRHTQGRLADDVAVIAVDRLDGEAAAGGASAP